MCSEWVGRDRLCGRNGDTLATNTVRNDRRMTGGIVMLFEPFRVLRVTALDALETCSR